jgi:hypothetical protein
MRAVIWFLERAIELALLGWFLYILFGATNVPGWDGVLENIARYMGLITYGYVVSGYLVTTFWLRVIATPRSLAVHTAFAVLLFVLHSSLFFLGTEDLTHLFQLQAFGVCIVVTASFIGSVLVQQALRRISSVPVDKSAKQFN